jgi:hypothetical protein
VSKDQDNSEALRRKLLALITGPSDLEWKTVPLDGGATIRVSNPFMSGGNWVPVTAQEHWAMALKFKLFPLTRAVADQAHMFAVAKGTAFKYIWCSVIWDFQRASNDRNTRTSYQSSYSTALSPVSGSHKYWLLSNGPSGDPKGNAVNYGFYTTTEHKKEGDDGGNSFGCKYLKGTGWFVVQNLGSRHNKLEADYSQLLQFMTDYTVNGKTLGVADLRDALLKGDPVLWDEPTKLRPDLLPF